MCIGNAWITPVFQVRGVWRMRVFRYIFPASCMPTVYYFPTVISTVFLGNYCPLPPFLLNGLPKAIAILICVIHLVISTCSIPRFAYRPRPTWSLSSLQWPLNNTKHQKNHRFKLKPFLQICDTPYYNHPLRGQPRLRGSSTELREILYPIGGVGEHNQLILLQAGYQPYTLA